MKEKHRQQMSFTDCMACWLVGFTHQKKGKKSHAACVLVICFLTRVINSKVVEDEAIYNGQ